jgi:serine/threonine-protein kinase
LKGKYAYMSPEQTQAKALDRRADLFSVGAVLYEALTGDAIFRGQNEFETMQRIVEAPVPNASSCAPGIPPQLDAVVHRALARNRDQRYQTAAQMLEDLEAAVRPSSAREVAACLHEWCGDRLVARRDALQSILEGRSPPLPAREARGPGSTSAPLQDATPASVSSVGSAGPLASTASGAQAQRPSHRVAVLAGIIASAAVAGLFVALWLFGGGDQGAAVAPVPADAAAGAATGSDAGRAEAPSIDAANEDAPEETGLPDAQSPKRGKPARPAGELHDNPYGSP